MKRDNVEIFNECQQRASFVRFLLFLRIELCLSCYRMRVSKRERDAKELSDDKRISFALSIFKSHREEKSLDCMLRKEATHCC
jgi:hypothetical protein